MDALDQMLGVQAEISIDGVTTLERLLERVRGEVFDLLLVDSEILADNWEASLEKIETGCKECPILITVKERDRELTERLEGLHTVEFIAKRQGYLSHLTERMSEILAKKKGEERTRMGATIPEIAEKQKPVASEAKGEGGYFICDRKGRFLSVNRYLLQLTGYSESELLELSLTDIISKEDREQFFNKILDKPEQNVFPLLLIDKVGDRHLVELRIRVLTADDDETHMIGFRGFIVPLEKQESRAIEESEVDQMKMVREITDIMHRSYSEPFGLQLRRIAQVAGQLFGFKRVTVALLDRKKNVFVKQVMIGFPEQSQSLHVPRQLIEGIFKDDSRVKVIQQNHPQHQLEASTSAALINGEQKERQPALNWHPEDVLLLNLTDFRGKTIGYISLDRPLSADGPTESVYNNLGLYSRLSSITIENSYRYSTLERKNRRQQQMIAESNIFKLYLSLNEILKEVVWSIHFTMEFNLVSLVLLSRKSGLLENKAVACDDKIKLLQIRELTFDLKEFSGLLKESYKIGRSYLIKNDEPVLQQLKHLYYGAEDKGHTVDGWPNWALLMIPVKSRAGKIIGFLLLDDPADCQIPSAKMVHYLEIMANQIAIAIDNRVMYIQAKEKAKSQKSLENFSEDQEKQEEIEEEKVYKSINDLKSKPEEQDQDEGYDSLKDADLSSGGFKKLVERFLR